MSSGYRLVSARQKVEQDKRVERREDIYVWARNGLLHVGDRYPPRPMAGLVTRLFED